MNIVDWSKHIWCFIRTELIMKHKVDMNEITLFSYQFKDDFMSSHISC